MAPSDLLPGNKQSTREFSSWHVKWPLKTGSVYSTSTDFSTPLGSKSASTLFKWCLELQPCNDKSWCGLRAKETNQQNVPVVFRLALQIAGRSSFSRNCFATFSSNSHRRAFGMNIPLSEAETFAGADSVLHCWIDIPNSVIDVQTAITSWKEDPQTTAVYRPPSATTAKLIDGVLGNDSELTSLSDTALVILNQQHEPIRRFYCHACILASRSDVFQRMLVNKEWKESKTAHVREVEITDIDDETMQFILEYIYCDQYPRDNWRLMASSVLHAADKYNLPVLMDWCQSNLIAFDQEDGGDRIEQLLLADRHHLHRLKATCIASLCTDLAVLGDAATRENIPKELLSELIMESGRRQMETEEITVSTA